MTATAGETLTHALSFDIEDWFHITEVEAVDNPALWPELSAASSIAERYTDLILGLCKKHNVRATFFILGWIAERHPALVRRIADDGHEIGTHSFWHRKVYELTPESFGEDIRRSISAIHAAAGTDITVSGFRAPSFSITRGSEWALDVLAECGIRYDASFFPSNRDHGGYDCEPGPQFISTPAGRTFPELPMSVTRVGWGPIRKKMCYSGGGYLRLLPLSLIKSGIEREAERGRPTVVYLHPRDFAPDCPRASMPLFRRFKCYVGLASTQRKLTAMLTQYKWDTCESVLRTHLPMAFQ